MVEDLLAGFTEHGWNIDLFCPTPTRGVDAETRKDYAKNKRNEPKYDDRLHIHRIHLYSEGKGFIPRAIRYFIFSIECFYKSLTVPADFIFTGSGPPTQGWIAGFAGKITKKKIIYNLQDIFPDSLVTSGICGESSILFKIGRKIESSTYKNADLIITISNDMMRNVLQKGVNPDKVVMIPNWIDIHAVKHIPQENNTLFKELNLDPGKFYITYAGNIGHVQAIDEIIEASEMLEKYPEIQIIIFGGGSEKENVERAVQNKKVKNVRMYPLQSVERVSEVYSIGSASIVSCRKGTSGSGLPSKTWSIMGASCAILGYFDIPSEFSNIITENQCGECVESGDIESLANKMIELFKNRDICIQYGMNGRKYVEEHASKEAAVQRYIESIENTMN